MADGLRLGVRMIAAGIWLSVLLLACGAAWIAVTGVRSPIVLLLFLTLVFAALSYPRWAVAVVSGASLLVVIVLSQVSDGHGGGPTGPVYQVGLMLALAVTGAMCIVQARIQEQIGAELERVSRADPLTGALNRLGFEERMAGELRRAGHAATSTALVLLDLDDFKAVNDRLGHAAGDELLCWAVQAMTRALRPGDAVPGGRPIAAASSEIAVATAGSAKISCAWRPRSSAS